MRSITRATTVLYADRTNKTHYRYKHAPEPNSGDLFSCEEVVCGQKPSEKRAVSFFTYGAKLEGRLVERYIVRTSINFSFEIPNDGSVFQAEIAAIKVAVDLLLWIVSSFIYPLAILTLSSLTVRSGLDKKCLSSLSIASSYFVIRLICHKVYNLTGRHLPKTRCKHFSTSFLIVLRLRD